MASKIRQPLGRLRLTLAILMLGFAIDGTIELYNYVNHSYPLPFASSVFVIGPFVTLAGLAVLWVGRSQWEGRLNQTLRLTQRVFALNILATALAVLVVFWYSTKPSTALIPSGAVWGFVVVVVAAIVLNFVIYVLVAFDSTGMFGKALLLIALGSASVVAIWLGQALGKELGTMILAIQDRTFDFSPVTASISDIESYFAVAYFLLTFGYLDAYRRIRTTTTKTS